MEFFWENTMDANKFQVVMIEMYGMEDPIGPRWHTEKQVGEFDSYCEAQDFAKDFPDEDFSHAIIRTPQWYRDCEKAARDQRRKLDDENIPF